MVSAFTKTLPILGAGLLITGLCSCGTDVSTNSIDVETMSIQARINFVASGDGTTHAEAYLLQGSTYLELIDLDEFYASANGVTHDLEEGRDNNNNYVYRTSFNTDEAGTYLQATLSRAFEDDARNSYVNLPIAPEILTPNEGDLFDINDELNVSWQPDGNNNIVDLTYTYSCGSPTAVTDLWEVNSVLEDTGLYTTTLMDIFGDILVDVPEGIDCNVTFRLSRMQEGVLDGSFRNGYIRAFQARSVSVTLVR